MSAAVEIHDPYSETVQCRLHTVELLAETISRLPADWGLWPDKRERQRLAGRLVFLNWMVREGWLSEWPVRPCDLGAAYAEICGREG